MFVVGLAITAMSILRIFYVRSITSSSDFTYDLSFVGLYSSIEAYLIQICCCMPATIGLIHRGYQWSTGRLSKNDPRRSVIYFPHLDADASKEPQIEPDFIRNTPPLGSIQAFQQDVEKAKQSEDSASMHDSAPSPIVQRSSAGSNQPSQLVGQRSFEQSRNNYARLTTDTNTTSTSWRTPEILYHDRQNQLRLEIHDPASEPIKANLTYVDRFDGKHDIELQGHPRKTEQLTRFAPPDRQDSSETTTSTSSSDYSTRPSTSPSASSPKLAEDSRSNGAGPKLKGQRSESRIDQLLRAHRILTERASLPGIEIKVPESMKEKKSASSLEGMEKSVPPTASALMDKMIVAEEEAKTNSQGSQATTAGGVGVRLSKADFF